MKSKVWALGLLLLSSWMPFALAAGKIAGYQYFTFSDGDQVLEGNEVHFIPCYPRNTDCKQLAEAMTAEAQKALVDLDRAKLTFEKPVEAWSAFLQLGDRLLPLLTQKSGYTKVSTQKKGVFSFYCPTQNCLVYSLGTARDRVGYWITIYPGRKRLDLGPSKAIMADKPLKL